ncbi:23S rRNA (adenine(2503)-C2)-methyltransferase [Verrucomicrobia bacterium SCGC AG-212-E04]|nr:23S rRNA (adenine(2503)-C2)-methyltransferase [Verrucomicrobia bacterium SCGC AG-212-E04]
MPLPALENLLSLTHDDLVARLVALGQPAYRAKQVLQWRYKHRVDDWERMTDLPAPLRTALAAQFSLSSIELVRRLGANDTTQKFLFRLADGQLIESVLIPASPSLYGERSDRRTLCVSTQVGCAYGCKFCASGLDGFTRNLTAGEIVEQILQAEAISHERVDNLVFMGMGEPLANFENLMQAIRILNNQAWGVGIGARHITISTSGLVPRIRELADQPLQVRLAISLHGATDEVRGKIMPVNQRYNVAALMEACQYWHERKKQRLTFEYILIAGVNDGDAQAERLAKLAVPLKAKINLIPYNTVTGLNWQRPAIDRQDAFHKILRRTDLDVTLRREKGHDIDAACGQLRRQTMQAT